MAESRLKEMLNQMIQKGVIARIIDASPIECSIYGLRYWEMWSIFNCQFFYFRITHTQLAKTYSYSNDSSFRCLALKALNINI